MSFDAWKAGRVAPAVVDVPVTVPRVTASPEMVGTLKVDDEFLSCLAVSPDGRTLAAGSRPKGEVTLWDLISRARRATLAGDLGPCYDLAFTPDGTALAAACYRTDDQYRVTGGGVVLWDVAGGRQQTVLRHDPPHGTVRIAVAPDGKTLAAVERWTEKDRPGAEQTLTFWDLAGRTPRSALPADGGYFLAYSPDGTTLARTASVIKDRRYVGSEVRLWDVKAGRVATVLTAAEPKPSIDCLAFSPDGRTLAGADYDGTITLWDVPTGKVRLTTAAEARRPVTCLALAPDGRTLAAGVGDRPGHDHDPGLVVLFDSATGRRTTLAGHTAAVNCVAFTPDGRTLVSGGGDRTVRLWDVSRLPAADGPK